MTHPVHLRTKADALAFIEQERAGFGVTRLCRVFSVTRAGYYAWRTRPVSAHARQDRVLLEEMRAIFEASDGTYGSPRVHEVLLARGHRVSPRRVERLMRLGGRRAGRAGVPADGRHASVVRPASESHRAASGAPREPDLGGRLDVLRAGSRWWTSACTPPWVIDSPVDYKREAA